MSHTSLQGFTYIRETATRTGWLSTGFAAVLSAGRKNNMAFMVQMKEVSVRIREVFNLIGSNSFTRTNPLSCKEIKSTSWMLLYLDERCHVTTPASWHMSTADCSFFSLPDALALPEFCCLSPQTPPGLSFSFILLLVDLTAAHQLNNPFYFAQLPRPPSKTSSPSMLRRQSLVSGQSVAHSSLQEHTSIWANIIPCCEDMDIV